MATHRKKLIEVALPLEAINKASVRESFIYRGNPSAIHKWWAQRPLAAARAVIFAQMVDDPSGHPDIFPTKDAEEKERQRLLRLIEDLVPWEATRNKQVLEEARAEIWKSWRRTCAENVDHPRAKELFDRHTLPPFQDPFAGGATLPLEAQRLGLNTYASDLNPVAVLINKAAIEIPPRFARKPPVNPAARADKELFNREWRGVEGMAEDVRYYGRRMRDEAEKRIGHLYPCVEITAAMAEGRPDLKPHVGQKLTVIAWLWARTVKSSNPAFAHIDVPLASTFMLSTKVGKEVHVAPVIESGGYRFSVKAARPGDTDSAKVGTSIVSRDSRGKKIKITGFRCVLSGAVITMDYVQEESKAGRMGARLMAVVVEGERLRLYLPPTREMEEVARGAKPAWKPDVEFFQHALGFRVGNYGMTKWSDLFTPRQLMALTTLSDLVQESLDEVKRHAVAVAMPDDRQGLAEGGSGAAAYAEAVVTYLAFGLSKTTDYNCSLVPWYTKEDRPGHLFSKQTIPMVWDYVELNPFGDVGGGFTASIKIVSNALAGCPDEGTAGHVRQADAMSLRADTMTIVSTDPPYYDNVGYADLSDFFYVWLRRSLKPVFPDLFATLAVPKGDELVATPDRHGGKERAETFFLESMTQVMHRLVEQTHPAFPVTIYYAFKQSETDEESGTSNTGWETFLDAVFRAGFGITGTWPVRTERKTRSRGIGSNALASSIVLVCRPRATDAPLATRREFLAALKVELPSALVQIQRSNIAPVDLAQAAIGPGMAVFTRYSKVLDAEGQPLRVREALALINQTLDEVLTEQEGDFDADSRWALAWFDQQGFVEGEFGIADVLARAKNTSVNGMKDARIIASKGGKVRLLKPSELAKDWDPASAPHLTAWEIVHQLIRALEAGGESVAATLVARLGAKAEAARELAYRLYTICERKKRNAEALSYNGLVQSWPEVTRLAREGGTPRAEQASLLKEDESA